MERELSIHHVTMERQASDLRSAAMAGDNEAVERIIRETSSFVGREEEVGGAASSSSSAPSIVDSTDTYAKTSLQYAASQGHFKTVSCLLSHGANIDAQENHGQTALHIASTNGHHDTVRFLMNKNADICLQDNYGSTALHRAAFKGHTECVRILLGYGAVIEHQGKWDRTALHWATTNGHIEVVKCLVQHGASLTAEDASGKTALQMAMDSDHDRQEIELFLRQQQQQQKVLENSSSSSFDKKTPEKQHQHAGMSPSTVGESDSVDNAAVVSVGQFQVLRGQKKLGKGGFGVVYKGFDKVRGIHIAVKESKNLGDLSEASVDALKSEFELLQSFHHPNIVSVYGMHFDPESSVCQIYMQLMSSGSVSSILEQNSQPLQEAVIRRYLAAILDGLVYLHEEKNVLHRDIKPGNILVDSEGVAKLSDFGTSKIITAGSGAGGMATTTAHTVGTCVYMSPECMRGKFSFGSDIWALGCSVLHMATGLHPWHHLPREVQGNNLTMMFSIASAQPPHHHPPIPTHLSPNLQELVATMLAFDPKDRTSAKELRAHRYFCGDSTVAEVDSQEERGGGEVGEKKLMYRRRGSSSISGSPQKVGVSQAHTSHSREGRHEVVGDSTAGSAVPASPSKSPALIPSSPPQLQPPAPGDRTHHHQLHDAAAAARGGGSSVGEEADAIEVPVASSSGSGGTSSYLPLQITNSHYSSSSSTTTTTSTSVLPRLATLSSLHHQHSCNTEEGMLLALSDVSLAEEL